MTIIKERIQHALALRDMSQSKLARLTGVDRAHISNIVRGTRSPSIEMAIKIASELNCSIDYLVGLDSVPNRK